MFRIRYFNIVSKKEIDDCDSSVLIPNVGDHCEILKDEYIVTNRLFTGGDCVHVYVRKANSNDILLMR